PRPRTQSVTALRTTERRPFLHAEHESSPACFACWTFTSLSEGAPSQGHRRDPEINDTDAAPPWKRHPQGSAKGAKRDDRRQISKEELGTSLGHRRLSTQRWCCIRSGAGHYRQRANSASEPLRLGLNSFAIAEFHLDVEWQSHMLLGVGVHVVHD